jgi:hypothetical protein
MKKINNKNKIDSIILNHINSHYKIYFIGIICLALYLFLIYSNTPFAWQDELTTVYASNSILENGLPNLPNGNVYTKSMISSYIISASIFIFGTVNEFTSRFPSMLFSLFSLLLIFYITNKFTNHRLLSLLCSLILVLSTQFIFWAKTARYLSFFEFFLLLSLYTFYEGFSNDKIPYKILSGFLFILSVFTSRIGLVLLPIFGLYFLLINQKFEVKKLPKIIINLIKRKDIIVFFVLITFSTYLLLMLFKQFSPPSSVSKEGISLFFSPLYFDWLFKNYTILSLISIVGIILTPIIKNKFFKLISLSTIVCVTFISFLNYEQSGLNVRYLVGIIPIFILFSILSLNKIIIYLKLIIKNKTIKKSIIFILFSLIVINSLIVFNLTKEKVIPYDNDYNGAYNYIKNNMELNDEIISTIPIQNIYYINKLDYVLFNSSFLEKRSIKKNNQYFDYVTNVKIITNINELKIKNKNRIWIISRGSEISNKYIGKDMTIFLKEEMFPNTIEKDNIKYVRIFLFENSTLKEYKVFNNIYRN